MRIINLFNLSKKKIEYKQKFIDRLIYQNNYENTVIVSINRLRILILIYIFQFEKNPKYSYFELLEINKIKQNEIYNSFENILWIIKRINSGKVYIPLNDVYRLFNFVEEKYINYFESFKKNKNILDLFFIGGYPKSVNF